MTDQPNGPTEPTPEPAAPATPEPATPPSEPVAPPSEPLGSPAPPQAPQAPQAPPVPPNPPAGPPPATADGAPQPQAPYGAPQPPPAYAAPQQPAQYGAQPGYPPPANPYGGYTQAPAYAGAQPAYPGSIGYVEQNFGKVADFGQRALAYLIDFAIGCIGLVPMIIGIIVLTVGATNTLTTDEFGNTTSTGDYDPAVAVVGGLLIALGAVVGIAIFFWNRVFKMGRTGQSVGKKAMGLFLLDDKTGRPIGAGMCFLRELVQGLVNQILYLGWLWMLWDTDKQTLGDKAVHSNVVVLPKG